MPNIETPHENVSRYVFHLLPFICVLFFYIGYLPTRAVYEIVLPSVVCVYMCAGILCVKPMKRGGGGQKLKGWEGK